MDRRPLPRPFPVIGIAAVILASWLASGDVTPAHSNAAPQGWLGAPHALPVAFIPNRGQVNSAVRFLANEGRATVFLTEDGMTIRTGGPEGRSLGVHAVSAPLSTPSGLRLPPPYASIPSSSVVRMSFVGPSTNPTFVGMQRLPGTANFFLGNDPGRWRTDLPTYAAVREQSVYRGIDLVYRSAGRLEYDWVVHPGANPAAIRMQVSGGARATLDRSGNLLLHIGDTILQQRKPHIYGANGTAVSGGFVLHAGSIGFRVGAYDRSKPLVIDPALSYSTYLGGSGSEQGLAVAADSKGATYIAGSTTSDNFPVDSALQSQDNADSTAFVAKLNKAGTALVYSTYLGGSSTDEALALAVDGHGNAYIAGDSLSVDYPTVRAIQKENRSECEVDGQRLPCPNAIVSKLNAKGDQLVFSTYLGGNVEDEANGIAVDSIGDVYLAGRTYSTNFPTMRPIQAHLRAPICSDETGRTEACSDAWAAKLNPLGSALIYSTYLGGNKNDEALGIAIDAQGNAYVCGDTFSGDFPTQNPVQRSMAGNGDAFAFELNATGTALVYSTYVGGKNPDVCINIAAADGTAFLTGYTWSSDFPTTAGAFDRTPHQLEAFVTRIAAGGGSFAYSTLLGGTRDDEAMSIAVDARGRAYVVGDTNSSDFPTKKAAQATYAGKTDAFMTELNAKGSNVVQSTYLGGSQQDFGHGVGLDPQGNVYMIGFTYSTNFPTVHAIRGPSGDDDVFIARVGDRKTVIRAKR